MEHLFKLKKDGKTVGRELTKYFPDGTYALMHKKPKRAFYHKILVVSPDGTYKIYARNNFIIHDSKVRFVTKDKHGNNVFAGDRIKRVNYTGDPEPREVAGQEGIVVWHHGFLQWSLKVGSENSYLLNDLVDSEIFEAGIELIEEKEDE